MWWLMESFVYCSHWSHVYSSESRSPEASCKSQSAYSCKVLFSWSESRNSAGPVLCNDGAACPSSNCCCRSRRLWSLARCLRNSACRSNAGGLMEQQECNYFTKNKGSKLWVCMQQLGCCRIAWKMYRNYMILFLVSHVY